MILYVIVPKSVDVGGRREEVSRADRCTCLRWYGCMFLGEDFKVRLRLGLSIVILLFSSHPPRRPSQRSGRHTTRRRRGKRSHLETPLIPSLFLTPALLIECMGEHRMDEQRV